MRAATTTSSTRSARPTFTSSRPSSRRPRFRDDYPIASARERAGVREGGRAWEQGAGGTPSGLDPARGSLRGTAGPGHPARPQRRDRCRIRRRPRRERSPREVELVFDALSQRPTDRSERLGAAHSIPTLRRCDESCWHASIGSRRPPRLSAQGPRASTRRARSAADVPAPPRRIRGARARGRSGVSCRALRERGRDAAQSEPTARSTGRRHGPGRLAGAARPSAHSPGDGQPALAAPFRPGPRRPLPATSARSARSPPPRAARLAGAELVAEAGA